MMAINHAMTGALIGLTIDEPAASLPLAFLSHFMLDAFPHYDTAADKKIDILKSKKFFYIQIVLGAVLCFLLVVLLALFHPKNWVLAAVCAFLGASPDLLSFPRFLSVKRTGKDIGNKNWFWRFHSGIQWATGPQYLAIELVWFAVIGALVLTYL